MFYFLSVTNFGTLPAKPIPAPITAAANNLLPSQR